MSELRVLYFSFRGNLPREPYVLGWLFLTAIQCILFTQMLKADDNSDALAFWFLAWAFAAGISTIAVLIMSLKRARDAGWPPVVALAMVIPAFSLIGLLIFSIVPTKPTHQDNDNRPTFH